MNRYIRKEDARSCYLSLNQSSIYQSHTIQLQYHLVQLFISHSLCKYTEYYKYK